MRNSSDKGSELIVQAGARRRRRWPWSAKEINRQGDDNTDNLVVLICSLGLISVVGIAFAVYYWGWPHVALSTPGSK